MNQNLRRLEVVGITYNQIEAGIYAVVLQEAGGTRRIPIVIGETEAQSIECKLRNIVTARPLTHDLFITTLRVLGYELQGVMIYKLSSGVFAADLWIFGNGQTTKIDSRSSDAIALAIRVNAPIYASSALLDEVGFSAKGQNRQHSQSPVLEVTPENAMRPDFAWERLSEAELEKLLQSALQTEFYELAAKVKQEIDRRKSL